MTTLQHRREQILRAKKQQRAHVQVKPRQVLMTDAGVAPPLRKILNITSGLWWQGLPQFHRYDVVSRHN